MVGCDEYVSSRHVVVNAFHTVGNLFHAVAAGFDDAAVAVVSGIVYGIVKDIYERCGEQATQFFLTAALHFLKIHAHGIRHIFAQMLCALLGCVENGVVESERHVKEVHLLVGQKSRFAVFRFCRQHGDCRLERCRVLGEVQPFGEFFRHFVAKGVAHNYHPFCGLLFGLVEILLAGSHCDVAKPIAAFFKATHPLNVDVVDNACIILVEGGFYAVDGISHRNIRIECEEIFD